MRYDGWFRLSSQLGLPLTECLTRTSYRQYRAWMAWLELQIEIPDRGDFYLMQATAEKIKHLTDLNALRPKPINLSQRIEGIARESVHNAFHYEALAYACLVGDTALQTILVTRIKALDRIMQSNIVE